MLFRAPNEASGASVFSLVRWMPCARPFRPLAGKWGAVPIDAFVGECAEEFYACMTPSEWEEARRGEAGGLHLRLASRCGYSDSIAEDAMEEIHKVAVYGWPAYVDAEMQRAARVARRDTTLFFAFVSVLTVVALLSPVSGTAEHFWA